jgi:hypothetical protein
MVLVGLSRVKWWMTGALVVALTSLAYAKPAFVERSGHGLFHGGASFQGASFGGPVHGNVLPRANISRETPRGVSMPGHAGRYARNDVSHASGSKASWGASLNDSFAGRAHGGNPPNYGAQRLVPPDVYRNRPAAQYVGTQYAGAITPVSTDSHNAPRPPSNAQSSHVGSIRDDVTRYNEERGASRPIPRPPGDSSRIPSPSPYRN